MARRSVVDVLDPDCYAWFHALGSGYGQDINVACRSLVLFSGKPTRSPGHNTIRYPIFAVNSLRAIRLPVPVLYDTDTPLTPNPTECA